MRTISGLVLLLDLPTPDMQIARRVGGRPGATRRSVAAGWTEQRLVWVERGCGWCLEAERPVPRDALRHAVFIKPAAVEDPVFGHVGVIRQDADWMQLLPAIDPLLARLGILDRRRGGRGMLVLPGRQEALVQPLSDLCRFEILQAALEAMIGQVQVGFLEIEGRVVKNMLGLDPHLEFDGVPAPAGECQLGDALVRR